MPSVNSARQAMVQGQAHPQLAQQPRALTCSLMSRVAVTRSPPSSSALSVRVVADIIGLP
jgi:hypothetical protein